MIAEDYVSFETAKLLKEKGFYQDFLSEITPVWKLNGNRTELAFYGCDNYPCEMDEWYSAPTLQMAMKWLRNIHDIACSVGLFTDLPEMPPYWSFNILNQTTANVMYEAFDVKCETYEEACEAAIKYCLENLI